MTNQPLSKTIGRPKDPNKKLKFNTRLSQETIKILKDMKNRKSIDMAVFIEKAVKYYKKRGLE